MLAPAANFTHHVGRVKSLRETDSDSNLLLAEVTGVRWVSKTEQSEKKTWTKAK